MNRGFVVEPLFFYEKCKNFIYYKVYTIIYTKKMETIKMIEKILAYEEERKELEKYIEYLVENFYEEPEQ